MSSVATENSATVEKDHVTRTDPASGTQQPQGTSVILYISTGQTTVPTGLVGKPRNEAVRQLNNNGFNTNIMPENSDSVAAGNVTRVNPTEGSTVSQGATITVYISSGPKMIDTPSQSSLSRYAEKGSDLASYLKSLGFTNVTVSGNGSDPVDTVTFAGKKLENISDSQIASNTAIVITTGSAPDPEG